MEKGWCKESKPAGLSFSLRFAVTTRNQLREQRDQGTSASGFENLKVLLAAAGAGVEHVVKVTLYLQDLKCRLLFHDVWREYFPKDPPARIAIQVADPMLNPGRNAHFALDVIALDPNP